MKKIARILIATVLASCIVTKTYAQIDCIVGDPDCNKAHEEFMSGGFTYKFEVEGQRDIITMETIMHVCKVYVTSNGGNYSGDITIPAEVQVPLRDKEGNTTGYTTAKVTGIGSCAFDGCKELTSVTIPEGIESIGIWAFRGCTGLKEVVVPSSVTYLGDAVFSGCTALERLTMGIDFDKIFKGFTSLKEVILEGRVTEIAWNAFEGCTALETIKIPENVKAIGAYAFKNCSSLKEIDIPPHVTEIRENTFYNCTGLQSVSIGKACRA
jgi:hypothetical protein